MGGLKYRALPVLALLAGLLVAGPGRADVLKWDMETEYPHDSMPGAGVDKFAAELADRSHGAITVIPSYDAGLGFKGVALPRAVEAGKLQLGDSFAGPLGEIEPIFLLSSLPFVSPSFEDALRLYYLTKAAYQATFAAHHQRLLYSTPWPPSGLWAKHPVVTPADLAGLSIRTYDETSRQVLNASGASAVNLSFSQAMPKLKDGSLQGVLSSGDGGAGRQLWDYLPSFTAINYALPLSFAFVNEEAYQALPADLKQAVESAARSTETAQWQLIRKRLQANYATMRANHVEITERPGPELKALLEKSADGAITDWKNEVGPQGSAVLTTYRTH